MRLVTGSKIGRYEVTGVLGSGGMGEVYQARDSRLERNIAIKILPHTSSEDPERLRRFEQEARSASALNHPNIVTVYELGQDGSTHFIAMELVEGTTVREMLGAGLLPMRKIIEIAAQTAEGLAKAHEAGITHRDLKRENLMLSRDGFVKILDFGLAKLVAPSGEQSKMHSTATAWPTRPHVVMGTAQYMSPEQASGRHLDFRSDQFSFGLILYEMVTGKQAFHKSTTAETMAAIIRDEATPLAGQNPEIPAPLSWAIERCLAKVADKRYASTRDLARELAAIRDRFSEKPVKAEEAGLANLPGQRTVFIGREKEIASARELLLREDIRLLTITGPGGIGKTRLAIQVAAGLAGQFSGGIHFVALSAINDPASIPSLIVQTLNLRETKGQSSLEILKQSVREAGGSPMLLVIDNFEHLVQATPLLAEILAAGPSVKMMVTSRAALRVYGEHEFPLAPLALPDPQSGCSLEALSQYPAIVLFVQRAAAVKPGFELDKENAAAVSEICRRLDGLPLAIELAAARVKVLSPVSMRARLTSRLQLLTGGARDMPQRQQTLRAAIDWSYDLLSEAEQRLFRRLAVFVRGCTLEAAEAVCDTKGDLALDLLDGMTSMVDKSLAQQVEPKTGESRFVMLETIREYALEKLQASGEENSTRRAHAAYCLVLAEDEAREQSEGGGADWLERLGLEHGNLRAALDWLTETGDAGWSLRLGAALFRFWEMREYFVEGREMLGRVLQLPAAAAASRARARVLFAAGVLASAQGDYAAAGELSRESLQIARQLGDRQGAAVSLNAMALHARDQGQLALASSLFEESLVLWREVNDPMAAARSLSNLANVVKLQGDYTRARALYGECLAIFQVLCDATGVAWSMNYQGDVAREQGDSAGAQELYKAALAIFRERDDRWGVAGTLADLGNLATEEGDHVTAHTLYRESIRLFQELNHKRGIARLLECFAGSAAIQREGEHALRLAGAAAALRQHIGAPLTPVEQAKLEAALASVRNAAGKGGVTEWLEGWSWPAEAAVEAALGNEGRSLSSCPTEPHFY